MKMDVLSHNNVLTNFPPILRKNFEELFCNGNIGVSLFMVNDVAFTKQFRENNAVYYYYYTLKVPYGGKRLSWELIFNPENLSFAPDFNFNDDTFTMSEDLDLIVNNIPSLVNWNVNNPKALRGVLNEFLILFKKQQIEKMKKDNIYSQLLGGYNHLIELVQEHDVEVYVENLSVHFLINISVDTSALPAYLQPSQDSESDKLLNPGPDTCTLKVSYLKLDGSRVATSLQLSSHLEQTLGNVKMLHIPHYSEQPSLVEYTSNIIHLIQGQVQRVAAQFKLRKEYINSLCALFGHSMIEFDSTTFSQGAILLQVGDYYSPVQIEIGDNFPKVKPTVKLYSVYCISQRPCQEEITDYPYSPRWNPNIMVQRLVESLAETIPKFKNHKHGDYAII